MSNGIKVQKELVNSALKFSIKCILWSSLHVKDLLVFLKPQVEMQSGIQFFDGITTEQIQQILIRSASDLITLENPNYQFVAARLLLFSMRKSVFGASAIQSYSSFYPH